MSTLQQKANDILALAPEFEMCPYTNDDDEVTSVDASWRCYGSPVTATASFEKIDGVWCLDTTTPISVDVDDDNGEDKSVEGLKEVLEAMQTELKQVFENF